MGDATAINLLCDSCLPRDENRKRKFGAQVFFVFFLPKAFLKIENYFCRGKFLFCVWFCRCGGGGERKEERFSMELNERKKLALTLKKRKKKRKRKEKVNAGFVDSKFRYK